MSMFLQSDNDLLSRAGRMPIMFCLLVLLLACTGFTALYSAAGGAWSPWAMMQAIRFCACGVIFLVVAFIPISWWFRLAWPAYVGGLCLLLAVEVMGHVGMGAQRWLDIGFMKLQPSELVKIAVLMVLARVYHLMPSEYTQNWQSLFVPIAIILVPTFLTFLQPDLGTGLMIVMAGVSIIFSSGVPLWWFGLAGGLVMLSIPVVWNILHEYQRSRILTFLNPEADPLGSGYHIMQSKIALGSGGWNGKGFLQGSQSRLDFLPEKQTDFIFTLWVEEWGMMGGIYILLLCGAIFFLALRMALRARSRFARLLILGLIVNFSLYVFINIAMVTGLIPVVGVPFPLMSYGGSVMLATLCGFGLLVSCDISRDNRF